MKQLTDAISYCGVLNPNMRVFDVIMRTEYGTSYNSYVVRGSEKTAIIDASHKTFSDAYLGDLAAEFAVRPPDYLVLNHTEPDHSGAVADLVRRYPDITLVLTAAAAVFIKAISNLDDLKLHVVKNGDEISLGDKTLRFIPAPFLHWPDTMFTYVPEEKAVFTCDFLGAHYCEPQLLDTAIVYPDAYLAAAKHYYDCIFGPFPGYVRAGLEKLRELDFDIALTSHGPLLTKNGKLGDIIGAYTDWSTEKPRGQKHIPIFYCTAYRNTQLLAEAIKVGIKKALPDAEVGTYNIIEHDLDSLAALLNGSDAFAVGSPTINRDAVPPVMQLLSLTDSINIAKRPAAVFGSYGWSGEGVPHAAERLTSVGCEVFGQYRVNFVPSGSDINGAVAFGENFAKSLK
ncbi:MAG: FprA family A-type flavoprotein [Oscillospiraceae bacterium]|jgi:flavorubredoxin|nr:FprA family A-type flavoprotein [Oscillospiraceae bacterium]